MRDPLCVILMLAQSGDRPVAVTLLIMLLAAAGTAMVLTRLRVATIPAYLIAGVLVGPSIWTQGLRIDLVQPDDVQTIGSFATMLLMFTIGLHMDTASMRGGLVPVLLVGAISTALVALLLWPLLLLAGLGVPAALGVAMALSMSSTAVTMRLLQSRREMHRVHGRIILGISICQDLLSLAMMGAVPIIGAWAGTTASRTAEPGGAPAHTSALLELVPQPWAMIASLAGMALMIALGRRLLPKLMELSAHRSAEEIPLVLAGGAGIGAAALAALLGFSPELGAFTAGFLLAGTPFKHQLAGQLVPMRNLFMAVFFTSVGMQLNLRDMLGAWDTVLLVLVATLGIKFAVITLTTWGMGSSAPVAGLVGLALAQAGEFTLVILAVVRGQGLIGNAEMGYLIPAVVLSLILTPPMFELGHRLRPALSRLPMARWGRSPALRDHSGTGEGGASVGETPAAPALARYVIIAGYGIVGRSLADRLEIANVPFCIVDMNQSTIMTQTRLGRRAVYGDISNPEVLESAGIHQADAVFLTIPDDEATLRACQTIRLMVPDIFIAARTSFLSKAMVATELGADQVIVEEVATAETMARQVLDRLQRRAARRV